MRYNYTYHAFRIELGCKKSSVSLHFLILQVGNKRTAFQKKGHDASKKGS